MTPPNMDTFMVSHRLKSLENPFIHQFPSIAGRINRFNKFVMNKPLFPKLVQEAMERIKGNEPPSYGFTNINTRFSTVLMPLSISVAAGSLFFINPIAATCLGVGVIAIGRGVVGLESSANARQLQDLLGSFTYAEAQAIADSAVSFKTSKLFEKFIWEMTGNPVLNEELEGFVAAYFRFTEVLVNFARSLKPEALHQTPDTVDILNALIFFFFTDSHNRNEKEDRSGCKDKTKYHHLTAHINKLQKLIENRQLYTFG